MYAYYNNLLSIPAKILYEDMELISYATYFKWCQRKKLVRTNEGKGKGNCAWVSFYDISEEWVKNAIKAKYGDPKEKVIENILERYIEADPMAIKFFADHIKPNGKHLSAKDQRIRSTSVSILNAIQTVLNDRSALGKKSTKIWKNISEGVNCLDTKKWQYKLPTNHRALQRKYSAYLKQGYDAFIHAGEGSKNAKKITQEIGNYLIALYSLPTGKLTIPEVLERYNKARETNTNWKELTESAVYNFLYQPENERIWTLSRHGKEAYKRKYKHTILRDKSDWFPNCYWAIDGTKLDWIHFWDGSSNKMGAKLKINVLFDVYSEKIIGWDIGFSESHVEHFKAIKMGVNEAGCRPYFMTYDNQSGHKMDRMQSLYNSLVAENGGAHYPGRAYEHGNPAEGLFNRLQQQVINKFWFNDGQSVTVRRDDNKMNPDFINSHKSELKTVEELYRAWEAVVNLWNNKKHPHYDKVTRNEVYQHQMPMQESLSLLEIMDKMWVEQKKRPITYKAHGLDLRIGEQKHQYEVYDSEGNIDIEFRRTSVGKKFIVRYDPDNLDMYIQLCEKDPNGNIVHIANAQPKRKIKQIPVLMNKGDKEQALKDLKIRELEYQRDKKAYEDIVAKTGISIESELADQDLLIKFKGSLTKVERSKVESNETLSAASRL